MEAKHYNSPRGFEYYNYGLQDYNVYIKSDVTHKFFGDNIEKFDMYIKYFREVDAGHNFN
jgi:hypothetical protein